MDRQRAEQSVAPEIIEPETNAPSPAGDLERRERELRDFVEHAAVPLHRVAADGTILWANRAELDFLGYSLDEYIGHNVAEFHVDEPDILDVLRWLKSGPEVSDCEARLRCRDGSIRHVSISSRVYREDGRFIHAQCVTLDITARKTAVELHERLSAIVESSDDAILSKDLNGIIQSWNRGAERVFGYTADEIIGKHISTLAFPERADEFPCILAKVMAGQRVDHYETRCKAKDGTVVMVSLTVSPIRDATGAIIGASKVARNIGEQTRITELQEHLAAIVESSDDAILSKDLDGIIRSWNRGAARLFGYTSAEIIGKHISTLAAPDRVDEIPDILDRIRRGERVDHYETKRRTKDGRILTVSLTVSPIRDGSGVIIGASKVARDVTERDRQAQALRDVNAELTRSNADLQQFSYSASHDLQEPLRMVSIYSELLRREFGGKLGASGDEYIGYAIQGALRMEELLKDLRAYAQASASGRESAEEIEASQVLDKALGNLEAAIRDSGAAVTRDPLPRVRIHELQLEQLFQNLIGNAIRYHSTDAPRIHVTASQGDGEWIFSVRDNGIGIDPQYQEQIFGIFKRLHSTAEYPGTGMGLAICQRIIERAGGRIWVDSQLGQGSTFFFAVPRREG